MDMRQLKGLVPSPGQRFDAKECLEAIPALSRLASTPQDPYYHAEGDVWTHTCMVVEALLAQPTYQQATEEQRFVLFISALLHDISKPDTTVVDTETGRIGQPGHSRRGAVDSRLLLWRAGVPFALREQICRIISVHQLPFFALSGNRNGQSPEFILHKLSWELPVWMLCAIAEADMQGRLYEGKQGALDEIELFRELAAEEGCLYEPRAFVDDYTRVQYFRGARVHPDYSLHEPEGSRVIVLSGMPASGKNTWVAKHHPDLPVISFDDAREALGLRHGENEGAAAHLAIDQAKILLREKRPFVWNSTHLSAQMRKKTLDLLYAYQANTQIEYLEMPEKEIYRRNTSRDTSLRNDDIRRMLFKWEVPLPTEAHQVRYHYDRSAF
ncbi:metal-dependent phosphohydrolase [Pseudomonas sp. PIC25]|uniref:AAA family ATPase n=1 Tax=Pseudomonas sp. PIC25 TaxID=1958773 RepID=UPI000BAB2839|nr:AAA family ATPase [Pseudomonas sp. PIC25]PAU63904.1 metal-dependent phosphohydrolase [Pseudomonas sp. PIC25]